MINRRTQIEELTALADASGPKLALLYGRRRVGKTYLLSNIWENRRFFYFLAANTTADQNRLELISELAEWTGEELEAEDFPSWRTVFRLLLDLSNHGPIIIVLDEFQYLMKSAEGVASQLIAVWDRELADRNVTLILCGSEIGIMDSLGAGDSPLYGRLNWKHQLKPFDYLDASRMVPDRSHREAAYIYGIFGGMPQHLSTIEHGEKLESAVDRVILSPRGEVSLQLDRLIELEEGIRDPKTYRAVLTAVAGGKTETNEIAQEVGLDNQTVRRSLETLESLDLVKREKIHGAPRNAPWKNRVGDHGVRFWYRFVDRNRSRLARGSSSEVWRTRIQPNLDSYMGKVFEEICREAFFRNHGDWGLADATSWSRWEGQDRNRTSIEIDVVAELDDGGLLTGEIKWSSGPVGFELHTHLVRDLEALARSGQAWAHEALSPSSHGHIYFSAGGFTEEFRERASRSDDIHLVDLDDIYAHPLLDLSIRALDPVVSAGAVAEFEIFLERSSENALREVVVTIDVDPDMHHELREVDIDVDRENFPQSVMEVESTRCAISLGDINPTDGFLRLARIFLPTPLEEGAYSSLVSATGTTDVGPLRVEAEDTVRTRIQMELPIRLTAGTIQDGVFAGCDSGYQAKPGEDLVVRLSATNPSSVYTANGVGVQLVWNTLLEAVSIGGEQANTPVDPEFGTTDEDHNPTRGTIARKPENSNGEREIHWFMETIPPNGVALLYVHFRPVRGGTASCQARLTADEIVGKMVDDLRLEVLTTE